VSTSFAAKSVCGPSLDAQSFTISLPVTSTSSASGSVRNTITSWRADSGVVSGVSQKSFRPRGHQVPRTAAKPSMRSDSRLTTE
jgi:hypothetical protein